MGQNKKVKFFIQNFTRILCGAAVLIILLYYYFTDFNFSTIAPTWVLIGVGIIIAIAVIAYRKKWFGPGSVSGSKTPQWPLIGVLIVAGVVLVLYFLLPQLRSTIPDYASTGTGNYQPPAPPPLQVACAECIPYGEHTFKKGVEYKIDYRSRIRFVQRDTGLLRLSLWMDTPQGSSGCDYVSYRTTTGLYDTVIHAYGLLGSGRLPEGIYTVKLYTAEEKLMQDDVVVRFEQLH